MLSKFFQSSKKDVDEEIEESVHTLDRALRPTSFDEFVGNDDLKEKLKIAISASKQRDEALSSIMLGGGPGLGKSSIAQIVANEYGSEIKTIIGNALESQADILEILTKIKNNGMIFIDEFHGIKPKLQEVFLPALEDFKVSIKVGKNQIHHIKINPFCLIAATTNLNKVIEPLRNRFGILHVLEPYSPEELAIIIRANARKIELNVESDDVYLEISKRSRGIPRASTRLLHRIRDYCEVKGNGVATMEMVDEALKLEGIDENGLNLLDRKYLETLYNSFGAGPAGINAIASTIGETKDYLETNVEPFLINKGLIVKGKSGRMLTGEAIDLILGQ